MADRCETFMAPAMVTAARAARSVYQLRRDFPCLTDRQARRVITAAGSKATPHRRAVKKVKQVLRGAR